MLPKQITSLQHDIVKHLTKLRKNKKYREQEKSFLLVGQSIIDEVAPFASFKKILSTSPKKSKHIRITKEIYTKITGHSAEFGMLAEVSLPDPSQIVGDAVLYLDDIQDPGNLGTILRTATAFNISTVLLSHKCCDPFNDKAIQSGRGAQLKLNCIPSNKEHLFSLPHTRYVAGLKGRSLSDTPMHKPYALILGNEGHGVSLALQEGAIEITIPIQDMESLNVAIASGIIMYHAECLS